MNFMLTLQTSVSVLTPQLQAIFAASRAVKKSDRFRKILELVLAFGNYLNSSRRGPAYGFKLQSLESVRQSSYFKSPVMPTLCSYKFPPFSKNIPMSFSSLLKLLSVI